MKECIFCKIARGEISAEKIWENENFFSIPDINPKVSGHSLVISKKHFETILDMPINLGNELLECIKNTSLIMMKKNNSEGFNLLNNNKDVAGQLVPHLHFHIFPRKRNDNFKMLI